jgi:hypothetical protein
MNPPCASLPRKLVLVAVASLVCLGFGLASIRPQLDAENTAKLASNFSFSRTALNSTAPAARTQRVVAPGLEGIRGWISAVGAAVSLLDLRGLGRTADACLVDPRDDSVTILPVPGGGGPSYAPFALVPTGLRYDATMAPMGCVPADVNADGAEDVTVYYWGRSPVIFLGSKTSDSAPTAADFHPAELVSPAEVWNTTALNIADVDGDGEVDFVVGNYFPDGARVLDPNSDGDRMEMQDSMGMARNAGVNRLFLGHPTGVKGHAPVLVDESTAFPEDSARSWTLALGAQDLTGDLLPEIYVANDFGPDQMLVNHSTPGHVAFTEVNGTRDMMTPKSEVMGRDSFKGMGVTFSYGPNQAMPMIAVSNITESYALEESNFAFVPTGDGSQLMSGKLPYAERSEALGMSRSGWSWDIKAGDFDNSGHDELMQATGFMAGATNRWPLLQELAMGNDELLHLPGVWPKFGPGDELSGHDHNPFWVPGPDGRFSDLSASVGLGQEGISRGIALGDVDGDGKLDALVANQWSASELLRNTSKIATPAIDVRIVRPGPGGGLRDAIGARVDSSDYAHLALPGGGTTLVTITWRDAGGIHTATADLSAGHHTVQLDLDGRAVLR